MSVSDRMSKLDGWSRYRRGLTDVVQASKNILHDDGRLLITFNSHDDRAWHALLEALQEYNGTIVFVSHDRYFIDKLATRVFEIGGGEVHDFPGNYEDYLWRKEGRQVDLSLDLGPQLVAEQAMEAEPVKEAPAKRVNPIKLKQMRDRCQEMEAQIAGMEAEVAQYEAELGEFVSAEQTQHTTMLLDRRRSELEKLMAEWEELSKEVEQVG